MLRKIMILLASVCGAYTLAAAEKPMLFIEREQIERAKEQFGLPELENSRKAFQAKLAKNERDWKKIFPDRDRHYGIEEILSKARTSTYQSDMVSEAVAAILCPSEKNSKMLREKLLLEIGIHKAAGSWRELGIHQGERLSRYLYAYDIAVKCNVLSEDDKAVIEDELHQAARFLDSWTMESPINRMYQGQGFCFNINYFPICMLGIVAMYFPDFEESDSWLAQAQEQVTRLLLTENFSDGAYGEGSIHYWGPTANAILLYVAASRNMGVKDYMDDPVFRNYFHKFVRWRMNLTGADGRKVAVGDAHRSITGSNEMLRAAYLLDDHEVAYAVKMVHDGIHGGYLFSPDQLLTYDASFSLSEPKWLYANYIWSGYGIYRSGWDLDDNFIMMKYGPTWAGRREIEKHAVIPGHSHQDCMNIEMHFNGVPMFVDGGYRGVYAEYETYGGFWKATIAHNTVGLGNDYGYSRTDGRFSAHVKKHGKEFRYEKEQTLVGRNDQRLLAFSDVEDMTYLSAAADTYKDVEHQRSVLWFRDNSLTVVYDELSSRDRQNYEWYLNPIGRLKSVSGDVATVGDDMACMDIIDVCDRPDTDYIDRDTEGTPDYYYPFHGDFKKEARWDGEDARWWDYTMVVKSRKAADAGFFTVLVPYREESPYTYSSWANGKLLSSPTSEIYISPSAKKKDAYIDADFAVLNKKSDGTVDYMIKDGYGLSVDGRTYVKSELESLPWAGIYDFRTTGVVGVNAKRATFILSPDPWEDHLVIHNPKLVEGKEPPVPIRVRISFYTGKAPVRMVRERSNESVPELDFPEYDKRIADGRFFTGLKNYAKIESRISRVSQPFAYDPDTGMVTVVLPDGFNHLVWE